MEAFMWRHHPQHARVRALIDKGEIGEPNMVRSSFTYPIGPDPTNVRLQASLEGGSLMDVGCYPVNVARWVFQQEPIEVTGLQVTSGQYGVDMTFAGVLRFADDRLAMVDSSFHQSGKAEYEIVGREGRIVVDRAFRPDAQPGRITLIRGQKHKVEEIKPANQFSAEADHFAKSVRAGRLLEPAEDGVAQARVIEALYESAASGRVVQLDLSGDRLPSVTKLDADEVLASFVPTRRFRGVSFDLYVPDGRYPSQAAALERMRRFARATVAGKKRGLRLFKRDAPTSRAVYLDGGYGVGKTHLLAATYHAVRGVRYYLSFAELTYTIARLGMHPAAGRVRRRATPVHRRVRAGRRGPDTHGRDVPARAVRRPTGHVVATSNTLPSDLGRGRFAADAFQRDIGEIASAFEVVSIDGEDFRHRRWDELSMVQIGIVQLETAVRLTWPDLAEQLERVHPIHYAHIAARLDGLDVRDLDTIADQAVALRLVHFVDKLYDQEVPLSVRARVPLSELFAASYRDGGYEKKYRRCLSRLHELVRETEAREQRAE